MVICSPEVSFLKKPLPHPWKKSIHVLRWWLQIYNSSVFESTYVWVWPRYHLRWSLKLRLSEGLTATTSGYFFFFTTFKDKTITCPSNCPRVWWNSSWRSQSSGFERTLNIAPVKAFKVEFSEIYLKAFNTVILLRYLSDAKKQTIIMVSLISKYFKHYVFHLFRCPIKQARKLWS